jgi:hypothetical protein
MACASAAHAGESRIRAHRLLEMLNGLALAGNVEAGREVAALQECLVRPGDRRCGAIEPRAVLRRQGDPQMLRHGGGDVAADLQHVLSAAVDQRCLSVAPSMS